MLEKLFELLLKDNCDTHYLVASKQALYITVYIPVELLHLVPSEFKTYLSPVLARGVHINSKVLT